MIHLYIHKSYKQRCKKTSLKMTTHEHKLRPIKQRVRFYAVGMHLTQTELSKMFFL